MLGVLPVTSLNFPTTQAGVILFYQGGKPYTMHILPFPEPIAPVQPLRILPTGTSPPPGTVIGRCTPAQYISQSHTHNCKTTNTQLHPKHTSTPEGEKPHQSVYTHKRTPTTQILRATVNIPILSPREVQSFLSHTNTTDHTVKYTVLR